MPLSPYVKKPLNSKVIKSFVPELRSRKCFSCFEIPVFYVIYIWTLYVHFAYPYMGIVHPCNSLKNLKTIKGPYSGPKSWSRHQILYVVYCNTNTRGNIIKHNLRTLMKERTHFFIKIYLSHFILERVYVFVVCKRWVERHILRERTFSSHIFLQEPGGANACTPLQARQRNLWSAAYPWLDCDSLPLSKSDRVVLITWSPSGYTPVWPESPDRAVPFTNHNVTVCQSTRGH